MQSTRADPNAALFGPCGRCGAACTVKAPIAFNREWLCPACESREKEHPAYPAARAAEEAQVLAGNYKFAGVGCPPELYLPPGRA
jgi:hypothetical protein